MLIDLHIIYVQVGFFARDHQPKAKSHSGLPRAEE
jgi:hypothetical protein